MIRILVLALLSAGLAQAEPVKPVPYTVLQHELAGLVDFEAFEPMPEPGLNLDDPIHETGVSIGEHFAGQQILSHWMDGGRHDVLAALPPKLPLAVKPGLKRANLSVAYHAGFGSVALFALGWDRFPGASARGEGAVAWLFDRDVHAFGLKIHSDYPDPLGTRPVPGKVRLDFFDRDGQLFDRHDLPLDVGITQFGFRAGATGIAGIVLTNTDPGGIALDDILYPLTGLSS